MEFKTFVSSTEFIAKRLFRSLVSPVDGLRDTLYFVAKNYIRYSLYNLRMNIVETTGFISLEMYS